MVIFIIPKPISASKQHCFHIFERNLNKKTHPYHYDSALYEIYCCLHNAGSARLLRHGKSILK